MLFQTTDLWSFPRLYIGFTLSTSIHFHLFTTFAIICYRVSFLQMIPWVIYSSTTKKPKKHNPTAKLMPAWCQYLNSRELCKDNANKKNRSVWVSFVYIYFILLLIWTAVVLLTWFYDSFLKEKYACLIACTEERT